MRVGGEMSGWEEVKSSVVQGCVLGGTLFLVFANDIIKRFPELNAVYG